MSDKQGMLNYLDICAKQALFDGDGNAEAMFVGLRNDVQSVLPESAFIVRASFVDGSEEKARNDAHAPVSPTEAPAAEPGAVEPVLPAEPVAVAGGHAPDPVDAPADPALTTAAAHEAEQDAKLQAMRERVDQLEAEKMAGKLTPQT